MQPKISSITKGPRQSNFELLRILAMFMILVIHANCWTFGYPTRDDYISAPLSSVFRSGAQFACLCAVNVFVMISGWFGIKPSIKGLFGFIFQCLYFLLGIYLVLLVTHQIHFSFLGFFDSMIRNIGWFIKAYLGLYILTPVLNAYLEKSSKDNIRNTLILFYSFQTLFGFLSDAPFISFGYSTFSFIGLYILSYYARHYLAENKVTKMGGVIYWLSVCCNWVVYMVMIMVFNSCPLDVTAYSNPLVILGAIGLILYFNSIKLKPNKFINWVAASSFAVYLTHQHPNIKISYFQNFIRGMVENEDTMLDASYVTLSLIGIYICSVILDQPRKYIWRIFQIRVLPNLKRYKILRCFKIK